MTQDEFVILSTHDMRAHLDSIGTDSTGSREELVDRHKLLFGDDTTSCEPADNWPKKLSRVAFPGILGEFVDAACTVEGYTGGSRGNLTTGSLVCEADLQNE